MIIPHLPFQRIFDQSTPNIIFEAIDRSVDQKILDLLDSILACCNANSAAISGLENDIQNKVTSGVVIRETVDVGVRDSGLLKQIHQLLLRETHNRDNTNREMRQIMSDIQEIKRIRVQREERRRGL